MVSLSVNLSLSHRGQRPGDLLLGGAQTRGVVQLTRGVLEAQSEQLATRRVKVLGELGVIEVLHL
jgi:hypothetical protein